MSVSVEFVPNFAALMAASEAFLNIADWQNDSPYIRIVSSDFNVLHTIKKRFVFGIMPISAF